mmetsp:Transcript_4443/g.8390  ORF Transcript_4443/g.8390 Transcript_4443/m.8390 type:complete len:265 (-) Transcript_4443:16-810(-)
MSELEQSEHEHELSNSSANEHDSIEQHDLQKSAEPLENSNHEEEIEEVLPREDLQNTSKNPGVDAREAKLYELEIASKLPYNKWVTRNTQRFGTELSLAHLLNMDQDKLNESWPRGKTVEWLRVRRTHSRRVVWIARVLTRREREATGAPEFVQTVEEQHPEIFPRRVKEQKRKSLEIAPYEDHNGYPVYNQQAYGAGQGYPVKVGRFGLLQHPQPSVPNSMAHTSASPTPPAQFTSSIAPPSSFSMVGLNSPQPTNGQNAWKN